MEIVSKILSIMKSKGIEQRELCEYLQISASVFSDWKSGRNKSYKKRLPEIASYLKVPIDYLLGKDDPYMISGDNELKNELIRLISQMNDEQLKELKDYADYLIKK